MKESKILFTDLDGTLLSTDKTVSEKNRKAISKALAAGHYITAATGRPVESARQVIKDLGLIMPGCYTIAFNGAVVYDNAADRILLEKKIPTAYVKKLFEHAKAEGIHVQTYSSREILTEKHTKELDYYCKHTKMRYKLVPDILCALAEEPNKVLLAELEDKEKLIKFQKDNLSWTAGKLESFFSCDQYLEYCPADTTKGSAISYLCNFLNIPLHNTVAVGDERNDISMLEAAQIGVAMKNANPTVKETADYITENDNDHDAIAEIVEKFML